MTLTATFLLTVYMAIAFIDGIWLHLWTLRLHERTESRAEHRLHTARSVLFAASVPLVFVYETTGVALWLGACLLGIDFIVGFWDAWIERDARASQGGLGRAEAALHIAASVIHGAMIALMLGARPVEAWLEAGAIGSYLPQGAFTLQWLWPGSVLVALLHVGLMHPRWIRKESPQDMARA